LQARRRTDGLAAACLAFGGEARKRRLNKQQRCHEWSRKTIFHWRTSLFIGKMVFIDRTAMLCQKRNAPSRQAGAPAGSEMPVRNRPAASRSSCVFRRLSLLSHASSRPARQGMPWRL